MDNEWTIIVAAIENKLRLSQPGSNSENFHSFGQDTPVLSFLEDGNQYVLDYVSDLDTIKQIEPEWKSLETKSGEPYTYFQSFDWCYQWCRTYCDPVKPTPDPAIHIFLLRRNNELVMVWPLMVTRLRAGLKNLTFLSEPHGQYGNVICNRKLVSVEIGRRIWAHIHNNMKVDAITLDQYPVTSMLHEIIDGRGFIENSEKHSSVLQMSGFENWDEFKSSLSRNERKRRNLRNNKLARMGEVNYEVHFGGSGKYSELVELALQWKIVWLGETGRRASVLSQAATKSFLSKLQGMEPDTKGERTLPTGSVLGALTLDGKPIGIEIGMCLDGHYYSYLGAFDWEYKKLSPGKIQIEMAQKWAKEAGLKKFDFLGDPADYKTNWTDTKGLLESRSFPLTARGFFYCVFWKAHLRPLARTLFNKMGIRHRARLLKVLGIGERGTNSTAPVDDDDHPINPSVPTMHSRKCIVDK